jgi:hypothetical protein
MLSDSERGLLLYEENVLDSVRFQITLPYTDFIGLSIQEIRKRFASDRSELEKSAILSLIAAAEAYLRVDYLSRVQGKKKDSLSRAFRKLFNEKSQRTALDKDLLKVWKNANRRLEPEINTFTELLQFRHRIAHGRYWVNKTNKSYTLDLNHS